MKGTITKTMLRKVALWLLLCQLCTGHIRRFCRTDRLPVVVLEKVHHDDGSDSSFRVVQQYPSSQMEHVKEEWSNATTQTIWHSGTVAATLEASISPFPQIQCRLFQL